MPVAAGVAADCPLPTCSDTVRDVGRPATGETFIARARVPKKEWDGFEDDAALIGSDRSKLINEFIGWIRRDAPLWRDARTVAAARGELLGSVITRAMRAYVSRNKDLLDE